MLWLRAYADTEDRLSGHGAGRCAGFRRRGPNRPRNIRRSCSSRRGDSTARRRLGRRDNGGVRTRTPIGDVACLVLEPGARISHVAVALAARGGTLVAWVGEAGVRLYAVGQPCGARSDRLLFQARLAFDESARLKGVRKMYSMRLGEDAPERRSVEQLRDMEGARVKRFCELRTRENVVNCRRRDHDPANWSGPDTPNR